MRQDGLIWESDTWYEWAQEWQKILESGGSLSHICGCLHNGFKTAACDKDQETERFLFYLDLAQGWRFPRQGYNFEQEIAKKSWAMLCQNLFRDEKNKNLVIVSHREVLLEQLIKFFNQEDNRPDPESENPEDKRAISFLEKMCKFAWVGEFPNSKLDQYRLQLVVIMVEMGWSDWFMMKNVSERVTLEEIKLIGSMGGEKYSRLAAVMRALHTGDMYS